MALQKGPEFWQPLLVKILGKRDQHSLSQKKVLDIRSTLLLYCFTLLLSPLLKTLHDGSSHVQTWVQAHKKLVKKASKILGLGPGNEEVNKSADSFLVQARYSASLDFERGPSSLTLLAAHVRIKSVP